MTNKYKRMISLLTLLAAPALAQHAPPPALHAPPTAQAQPPGLHVAQAAGVPAREAPARAVQPVLRFGVDDLLLEASSLPNAPEAHHLATLRASAYALWQPSRAWEMRVGARMDGASQGGGPASFTQWRADLTDTYVRWRDGETRLTLGAQTIVWGRVDAMPLIDRVSRADLTRFIVDDLPDRRRPQPALRWEQTWDDIKLDAVLLQAFRGARLPAAQSVWSPVNQTTGEVIGIAPSPQLAALVRSAVIDKDDGSGSGGAAVRLTRAGDGIDLGLTLARTRQSLPYYRVNAPAARLTEIHPYNNFVGLDGEWVAADITWRTELGYTAGVPVTRPSTEMLKVDALEWVGALEFFPGGGDTRVNFQLALRSLRTDAEILELRRYAGINGEVETSLAQGRWKVGLRFASGLNVHDVYLAPTLSFVGWEPHEISLAAHYFKGAERTLSGFHRDHDLVALAWRTRF